MLAIRCHETNPERHFVAGLLASVGRLALYHAWPEPIAACMAAHTTGKPLHLVERAAFSFDQAALGGALLKQWGLPVGLVESVSMQYGPMTDARHPLEPALVHVGSWLACAMSLGCNGERNVPPLDQRAWDLAGCPEAALESLVEDIHMQATDLTDVMIGVAA